MTPLKLNKNTKTYELFEALKSGEKFTASQAEKRFGIKNISAEASRIRQAGYAVYATHPHKRVGGPKRTVYLMGNPSRKVIAAGYRAIALGLV
jgi:hypothetical protein